jgi:HK97 family phage prohead protease
MNLLRKGDAFFRRCPISQLQAIDVKGATVDAMVSTVNPDRYREIVVPSAFARRLDAYRRNPMHLWAHDPRALENVIGRALDVQATKGGFMARFQYAVDENPKARMAFDMIRAGFLNAYSVGFYIHEWITPKELDKYPEIREELGTIDLTEVECIFIDVELFEVSLCAVPANRESLVVGRAADGPSGRQPGEAARALEMLTDLLKIERSQLAQEPSERAKMNVKLYDCAARLRTAASVLESSRWYDDDPEDVAETRDGLVEVLDDVRAAIVELFTEDEGKVAASAPPASEREGRSISRANAACIRGAHVACTTAMEHLEDLMEQLEDDDETDDDPDDVELEDDMELDDMDEEEMDEDMEDDQ